MRLTTIILYFQRKSGFELLYSKTINFAKMCYAKHLMNRWSAEHSMDVLSVSENDRRALSKLLK